MNVMILENRCSVVGGIQHIVILIAEDGAMVNTLSCSCVVSQKIVNQIIFRNT